MPQVTYDSRAVIVDDRRRLLLSGAIHYPRSTPGMWPDLMKRSRDAGLNTIETYVFWNLHEHRRGVLDFSGRLDLLRFCRLAQENGLYVILRIGPYICAETNYGGFPPWLRDVPDMQMRTHNEPFMHEMERWVRLLCEYLRPMFAGGGGPIILAQLENEYANVAKQYGQDGERYLQWVVSLGQSLNLGIPWIMCAGSAPGSIETINSHWPHTGIQRHRQAHPEQPALCTELWAAWYDIWLKAHHVRSAESLASATARFVAEGGAGVNYYMWHGGTNFGRESMFLQTTSYDFNAPLDEYGLVTTKSNHVGRLHRLLAERADVLLGHDPPAPVSLGAKQCAFTYGSGERAVTFLCNDDESAGATMTFENQTFDIPPRAVALLEGGKVLINTGKVAPDDLVPRTMKPLPKFSPFESWAEPVPADWPDELRRETRSASPVEQLSLTQDKTDYCWYTVDVTMPESQAGEGTLSLDRAADIVYVYVDGRPAAPAQPPVKEDRGPVDSVAYKQDFPLKLAPGRHELSLLCCSLGMIKGDWMLGRRNMVEERKGLWGPVRWNGKEIKGPWRMQPGLVGERLWLFSDGGTLVKWRPVRAGRKPPPLCWYRTTFPRPRGGAPVGLDMTGMGKGLAWVNGRCIGRYWNLVAQMDKDNWLIPFTDPSIAGHPTQRYYHVPLDWLEDRNTLVVFEELGGDPSRIRLCRRV